MKKNHSHKSRSKKNRNYKNVKEYKNMEKIEKATEFIAMNQQKAQENMIGIVKELFEMAELSTECINQDHYRVFTEQFLEFFNDEPQRFCEKVLTADKCYDALDIVLTADEAFVEKYNDSHHGVQFPLFLQIVSLLTCCNYTDRASLLGSFLEISAKANEDNCEGLSMRAWMLFWFLLDPTLVIEDD